MFNNKWKLLTTFGLAVWLGMTLVRLFQCGFVLDDVYLIVNNRWLTEEAGLGQLLRSDLWAGEVHPDRASGYYRPVFLLSIWLDHYLWGLEPLGYHLHSLFWQVACGLCAYRLFQNLDLPNAHIAAALFLLHPLQTETTYWIVARNDTMALSFTLLFLNLWAKPSSIVRDSCGGIILFLALGSKETAFVILPLLYLLARGKRIELGSRRTWIAILIPVLFVVYRISIQPGDVMPSIERWRFLFTHTPKWLTYMLGKLILPMPLASHMPIHWLSLGWHHFLGVIALLFLIIFTLRHSSRLLFVLGAVCLCLSILTVLPPLAQHGLIGDRYLGFALLGICIWLAALPLNHQLWMTLIVFPMAFMSVHRGLDWQTDLHIWKAAHRDYPSSFTDVSLAHIYYNNQSYDLAYEHYLAGYSANRPFLNACDVFVVSALKSKGLLVANEKGSWALQRGCKLTGEFAGAMGVVNIGMREWSAAREMCLIPLSDFYKKKDLVCAAVAYVDGDLEKIESYRRTWSDQSHFDRQLSALLLSGGLKP